MFGRLVLTSLSRSSSFSSSSHASTTHLPALMLGIVGGGVLLASQERQQEWDTAQACGIVGVVGKRSDIAGNDARAFLLEGLTVLQNRGYDSAGLATLDPVTGAAKVTKYASRGDSADSIKLLKEKSSEHSGHHVGIAHTRWATHGGKTDENAHPHTDQWGRIALVHNGTINNANALRRELQEQGVVFTSETDTEVIAQLIGFLLEQSVSVPAERGTGRGTPTLSIKEATAAALSRCDGTWGIAVMSSSPPSPSSSSSSSSDDSLVLACNGSPMTIGLGQGKVFVASEPAAFNRYTKNFIAMQDGEIGVVAADGTSLDLSRIEVAPNLNIESSPAPYPHWTIKECLDQPSAIARALGFGGRLSEDRIYLGGLDRSREKMSSIRNLILAGCGTSLNASLYGAKLMREYDAFETATAMDAAEIREHDFPRKGGGVLAVSQSGETKDVHRALVAAIKEGLPCLSVVNAVGSLIARTTQVGVYCHAGRENAVASTKAFTTQVTVLALVACWFRQLRDSLKEEAESLAAKTSGSVGDEMGSGGMVDGRAGFGDLSGSNAGSGMMRRMPLLKRKKSPSVSPGRESTDALMEALQRLPISFGMANRLRPKCAALARKLKNKNHLFILGKGYAEPIAYEGALKIKECAYLHAEGYSGGALKHGPFALIEGSDGRDGATPIIMLILDDEYSAQMRCAAEEVRARGADVYIITDNPALAEGLDNDPLVIPRNGPLTALTAVLPLQFLAYELAVLKGINPDVPRNLAKAVTVD